jgi:hypothetical protein
VVGSFRLDRFMHVAGSWYTSPEWWGVIVAVMLGLPALIAAVLAVRFGSSRRRLEYRLIRSTALLTGPEAVHGQLEIYYMGHKIRNPHVVEVEIASTGWSDITSDLFDQGRPVHLNMAVPIVRQISSRNWRKNAPTFEFECEEELISFAPTLLVHKQGVTVTLITDGHARLVTCRSYLADVDVREFRDPQRRDNLNRIAGRILMASFTLALAVNAITSLLELFFYKEFISSDPLINLFMMAATVTLILIVGIPRISSKTTRYRNSETRSSPK